MSDIPHPPAAQVAPKPKVAPAPRHYVPEAIIAALSSAVLLGLAPIFGKQALREGMDIFVLVVLRTSIAALLLWVAYAIWARQFIYIYPAGLIACATAGAINGVGSLMY